MAREPFTIRYVELSNKELWWCNSHQRRATYQFFGNGWTQICCDPNLGGIMMPCICVCLTGIAEIVDKSAQKGAKKSV